MRYQPISRPTRLIFKTGDAIDVVLVKRETENGSKEKIELQFTSFAASYVLFARSFPHMG